MWQKLWRLLLQRMPTKAALVNCYLVVRLTYFFMPAVNDLTSRSIPRAIAYEEDV